MRHGSALGWDIDAFHGEVPAQQSQHGQELLKQVPSSVRLHMVPSSRSSPSYKLTPQIDGGFANALQTAEAAIQRLSASPPSVVLASGPPFYSFVAALFVARHFSVPLVLDYRDEWSECPFDFVVKHRSNRAWETRCLKAAAAVLFTTQSHLDHQLHHFPALSRSRCHLVPNGWEADDFAAIEQAGTQYLQTAGQISIAHVGTLAGHTPIKPFLSTMDALLRTHKPDHNAIKLKFVGRRTPEVDQALASFPHKAAMDLIDHLPKRQANQLMRTADVQLLIASKDLERYLPGKLFDYLAARRPILVFGADGEASKLVESLGMGCRVGDEAQPEVLLSALQRLMRLDVRESEQKLAEWLAGHRRDALARRAFEVFEDLLNSHDGHHARRCFSP
ncbi:MAG: glycosyltransferase [Rubrivivax sp.]